MTFPQFHARLKRNQINKHVEKESTFVRSLQRDFQVFHRDHPISQGSLEQSLRGNEQRQMEHGFGVAEMNCLKNAYQ